MHPKPLDNAVQRLAEARVAPGCTTRVHLHRIREALYRVTAGIGRMTLGDEHIDIGPGDTVAIFLGTPHGVENCGDRMLEILCYCTPPYSAADTELLER